MMLKDKLKKLRKKCGLTQTQLGNRLGVTQQAVERWENGRTEPNASMLIQISNFFGVTVDYLLDVPDDESNIDIDRNNVMDTMIKMYKKLSFEERQVINRYVDSVIDSMGYIKKEEPKIVKMSASDGNTPNNVTQEKVLKMENATDNTDDY